MTVDDIPDIEIVARADPDGLMVRKAKFYLVWQKDGGAPRISHHKEATADKEAERLARKNPGLTFVVLSATKKFKIPGPTADGRQQAEQAAALRDSAE